MAASTATALPCITASDEKRTELALTIAFVASLGAFVMLVVSAAVETAPLRAVTRLADAFPHFVLAQFPDRSAVVEEELAQRTAAARAYRAGRRPGSSVDPVLQRIYDRARATPPA